MAQTYAVVIFLVIGSRFLEDWHSRWRKKNFISELSFQRSLQARGACISYRTSRNPCMVRKDL